MLLWSVIAYLIISIAVGLGAAFLVKNNEDYHLAGRRLPLYISAAALFATWFGSETVLGASSMMAKKGVYGVIEDPFGASLCLFLLGAFFARKMYRMNILTIGDFYGERYGKKVELVASICLILSYLGWIAAQMVAMGIILHVVSDLEVTTGILIGSFVVILYTAAGGMWSVSISDFMQMILIIIGLVLALWQLTTEIPLATVIERTPKELFVFFKGGNMTMQLNYFAAWITIGFGSIPQQDVFQRVMSAGSEKTAVRSSFIAGVMYLTIAVIPLIMALYARLLSPEDVNGDSQLMLPHMILKHTGIGIQILFFGALLSAVKSAASGALLAPSTILSENIIHHFILPGRDKLKVNTSRICVVIVASVSLCMALMKNNIYELVGQSSALSLVSLFIPLVCGMYSKRANATGAMLSALGGMAAWVIALMADTDISPLIYGLVASALGMAIGMVWGANPSPNLRYSLQKNRK
jgi:SSS family solute:Na+ symporter